MRTRRAVLAAAMVLATVAMAGPAGAAPPDPGNSKDCGDFPGWNEAQVWYETYAPDYGDVAQLDSNGDGVACESLPGAPAEAAPPAANGGYWMLEGNGTVFGFGDARPLSPLVRGNLLSIASAPDGGYWVLTRNGTVHSRGTTHHGHVRAFGGIARLSSIVGHPEGAGYWVFGRDGRVIPFGSAKHHGDMLGQSLNGEIVAAAATPTGNGYWMVGSDGGIFTFGDARFRGSTGALQLNQPIVAIAPDPDGDGYWLVAADGGVFAFNAPYRGSVPEALGPGRQLTRPIVGGIAYGNGYLMVASDGGIFPFSNKAFFGSLGATPPLDPIVGVAARR